MASEDDDGNNDSLGLRKMYAHSAKVDDYDVFWDKQSAAAKSSPSR